MPAHSDFFLPFSWSCCDLPRSVHAIHTNPHAGVQKFLCSNRIKSFTAASDRARAPHHGCNTSAHKLSLRFFLMDRLHRCIIASLQDQKVFGRSTASCVPCALAIASLHLTLHQPSHKFFGLALMRSCFLGHTTSHTRASFL